MSYQFNWQHVVGAGLAGASAALAKPVKKAIENLFTGGLKKADLVAHEKIDELQFNAINTSIGEFKEILGTMRDKQEDIRVSIGEIKGHLGITKDA